jgi:U4/U6.U5 tri-snRNP-associated protein 2
MFTGVSYLPGFVGLNNLSATDYVNVTLHALSHVTPLRNFFLDPANYSNSKSTLVQKFGEVFCKILYYF